jgi:hypothetical protein
MAFYGDLFRPPGSPLGVGDPVYHASDVDAGVETELLLAWWAEAARIDQRVVAPSADTLVRTPGSVQAAATRHSDWPHRLGRCRGVRRGGWCTGGYHGWRCRWSR